ncbi:MAG: hypothetical protein AAGJ93_07860 [Bacteroidota bacterium]
MANTIVLNRQTVKPSKVRTAKPGLLSRYLAYCDKQMKQRTLWYLIPLISLCGAVMPIGIFLISYISVGNAFLLFAAFSMLTFFANVIVNISEQHTRVTITTYWATVVLHILIPLFCYLFM